MLAAHADRHERSGNMQESGFVGAGVIAGAGVAFFVSREGAKGLGFWGGLAG